MSDYDEGNPLFQVFADIGVTLGHIRSAVDKTNKYWEKSSKMVNAPVLYKFPWSMTANASGFGIAVNTSVAPDGPDQGHIWYLRNFTCFGPALTSTIASGTVFLLISAMDFPNSFAIGNFTVTDVADFYSTLPVARQYSRGAISLRLSESFTLVANGLPANQQLGGIFEIEDFEEGAIKQEWAV